MSEKRFFTKFKIAIFFFSGFLATFSFAQEIILEEQQVYVCPLATKMEEINPKCHCRIDLVLFETVTSTCPIDGKTYEMTLTITEYEGKEYFAILGFENGGAGVNLKPEAKIWGNFEGAEGEVLSFSGAQSFDPNDDPLDFYWDFGDGNFATGKEVTHAFLKSGNYLLTLTVSDGLASSSATATISIYPKPLAGGQKRYLISPPIEKEKPKEKEQTKFLATLPPEIAFKIPLQKEILKETKKETKEEFLPKAKEKVKKSLPKETLLASLSAIFRPKNLLIGFLSLFLLFFLFKIYLKKL